MRTSEKGLAQGSDHSLTRRKRIERIRAKGDKAVKVRERTLDHLVSGPAPRRGRPALPAEAGKRYPLGIRTTKALREALLSASRASGRSLAQEIEIRLERSIGDQQRLGDTLELAFGRDTAAVILAIGCAIKMTITQGLLQPDTSKWISDWFAVRQAIIAIETLMYAIKPKDELPNLVSLVSNFHRRMFLEDDRFKLSWESYLEMLKDAGNNQGKMVARAIVYPHAAAANDGHPEGQTLEDLYLGPWGPTIRKCLGEAAVARIKEAIDKGDRAESSERKNRQGD